MPSHWTYEGKPPEGDLYQGDIILRTEPLLEVLGSVHRYFCDEKYLAFIVITQTCDLIVRNGKCKASYINLAVIRSLESLLQSLLDDRCQTPIPGVYYDDGRADINELIERIINQNEQTLGLFYLEPDGDLRLAVGSVALLRVSIALRSQHYGILKEARIGRLESSFRNKLGWLAGNLFSRVDTPDWPEEIGKKDADRKIEKIFKDVDEAGENVWVPRPLLNLAISKDEGILLLSKEEVAATIRKHAPKPPHEEAAARVKDLAPGLLQLITFPDLDSAIERVKGNPVYSRLSVDAIVTGLRASVEIPRLLEFSNALSEDPRLVEGAAISLLRLASDFKKEKGRKTFDRFFEVYMTRPIVAGMMLEIIREDATAIGIGDAVMAEILQIVQMLTPSDLMREYILLALQAQVSHGLAARLASSLKNDPTFKGAFAGP